MMHLQDDPCDDWSRRDLQKLKGRKSMESINESVGPFRSELAAKMYRETFMIAQGPHSHTLSATVRGNLGGWFVDTTRQPEGVAA